MWIFVIKYGCNSFRIWCFPVRIPDHHMLERFKKSYIHYKQSMIKWRNSQILGPQYSFRSSSTASISLLLYYILSIIGEEVIVSLALSYWIPDGYCTPSIGYSYYGKPKFPILLSQAVYLYTRW